MREGGKAEVVRIIIRGKQREYSSAGKKHTPAKGSRSVVKGAEADADAEAEVSRKGKMKSRSLIWLGGRAARMVYGAGSKLVCGRRAYWRWRGDDDDGGGVWRPERMGDSDREEGEGQHSLAAVDALLRRPVRPMTIAADACEQVAAP